MNYKFRPSMWPSSGS